MNSMTQMNSNINFDALLTHEDVQIHESNNINILRRITLLSLTRSYEQLLDAANENEKSAEAFLSIFEKSNHYVEYLKEVLALAEQANARLSIVADAYLQSISEVA